jgi:hypothetical protein
MANIREITKSSKLPQKESESETISQYSKSTYFQEKDKKAIDFLKKHPVPSRLLK